MRVTRLIHYIRNKASSAAHKHIDYYYVSLQCGHAHEKILDKSQTLAQWIVNEKMGGECELHAEKQIVVRYFTTALPKILPHTFHVMKNCEDRHIQDEYYTFKKN